MKLYESLQLQLVALLLGQVSAQAQTTASPRPHPMINNGSAEYAYIGCYEETIALTNTSHLRALHGGMDQVGGGRMTVPNCLDFCSGGENGNRVPYEYAGLEYSR